MRVKEHFKPLESSLQNELNTVFEGLGTHIGLVAQAAQTCDQRLSEANILDLQSTLLGVFNHVLTGVADREISASAFVSTPVLPHDSTEYSAHPPLKKLKSGVKVPSISDGEAPANFLINFDLASAVAFLSKKYPEKNEGIIGAVARFFHSGNQDLILHDVVKNNGKYHRGFKQNPASSLTEEDIKAHHLRCAWSLLSGCVIITDPDEAFSLFYNESRGVSRTTKENFVAFYFSTMHQLYILKKKPSESNALIDLSKLEVAEFKAKIVHGTYFSENEASDLDDAFDSDEFNASEVLGLGLKSIEDEFNVDTAKQVLPGYATEGTTSVVGEEITYSCREGDALGAAAPSGDGIPGIFGEQNAAGSEKGVQAGTQADGEPIGEDATNETVISCSVGGSLAENSKANHPDGNTDHPISPPRASKKPKVWVFAAYL